MSKPTFMKTVSAFLAAGVLLAACAGGQPKIVTVEVTRLVPATQLVPVEVTRVVRQTQLVPVEVTRVVRETVLVTPVPAHQLSFTVVQGVTLQASRTQHTAARLADDNVVLVGGSQLAESFIPGVELFETRSNSTRWVTPLLTPRHQHSTTLLQDGRLLVVGGYNVPETWLRDALLYDPASDTWTVIPPHNPHGVQHSATLLKDGRVLVVGGCIGSGLCTERADLFDPRSNTWSEAAPLRAARASHSALLLQDGRVLVAGGSSGLGIPSDGSALLYDPQTNSWSPTGPMVEPRNFAGAAALPGGRILLAGGLVRQDTPEQHVTNSAEVYDPASNSWSPTAPLSRPRQYFTLVALPVGQVLAVGGASEMDCCWSESSFLREIEAYDPATGLWRVVSELPQPRAFATATLLADGSVWIAGGHTNTTHWYDTWLIIPGIAG